MAIDTGYFEGLEKRFDELLKKLEGTFSVEEVQEVREFIDNREFGIAVETVVDIAIEEGIELPQSLLDELRDIFLTMHVAPPERLQSIQTKSVNPGP